MKCLVCNKTVDKKLKKIVRIGALVKTKTNNIFRATYVWHNPDKIRWDMHYKCGIKLIRSAQ